MNKEKTGRGLLTPALSALFFFSLVTLAAAAPSYDPYGPLSAEDLRAREEKTRSAEIYKPIADVGAIPFDVLKLALDPILYQVEDKRIPRKLTWIFDKLNDRGVMPKFIQGGMGRGLGLDVELFELFDLEQQLPHLEWKNEFLWVMPDEHIKVLSEFSASRIMDSPFSSRTGFYFDRKDEEDFWGIGPNSMRAQGSNFDHQVTELYTALDYHLRYETRVSFETVFQHTKIGNGHDEKMNPIKTAFPNLPGINGSNELQYNLDLENDQRDVPGRPTRGHLEQMSFGYHHGVDDSPTRYFKYTTNLGWFWPVFSNRRVLAVRFYGEHNSEIDGNDVPFFNKARAGGHDSDPDESAPLRSYKRNRFVDNSVAVLNVEYRYKVWEYRDYSLDTVLFWDEGQVFDKFSEWQTKDLEASYGFGFRLFLREKNLVNLEFAHGDEGTEIYTRTGTVF